MSSLVRALIAYIDERLAILADRIESADHGIYRDQQIMRHAEVLAIATRLAVLTNLKGDQGMDDLKLPFVEVNNQMQRTLPNGHVQRLVMRKSVVSGKITGRLITATLDQWAALDKGALIQNALPHVSVSDREFMLSGMSDEEWDELAREDDEAPDGGKPPGAGPEPSAG